MYTNFPLVDSDYRYGGVSNAYVIDWPRGGGGGRGKDPGPIRGIVEWVQQSREFPPGDGGFNKTKTLKPPVTSTSLV